MSLLSFSSCSIQDLHEVIQTHGRIRAMGIQIRCTWVPAHVGVEGNEAVDVLAKQALSSGAIDVMVSMSKSEGKSLILTVMVQRWQDQWNRDTKGRHLFHVQGKSGRGGWQEETEERELFFFTRLRVGHGQLNKTSNLIGNHPTGKCDHCQEIETVEYVLILCGQYERERERLRSSMM